MITINLKPGAKRQAPKGDPFAAWRERARAVRQRIKDPGLVIAAAAWIVVIGVIGGLTLHTQSQIRTLEPQLQQASSEFHRYHVFVEEKHHAEKIRDSILAQIGTIASVDGDRYTWPHILDEVASAVPPYTWLTSVATNAPANQTPTKTSDTTVAPPVTVVIAGETSDLENYTAFLRRLGESPWLADVLPVQTQTVIDHDNRPMTTFTIQATFNHADPSHLQMVPVVAAAVR